MGEINFDKPEELAGALISSAEDVLKSTWTSTLKVRKLKNNDEESLYRETDWYAEEVMNLGGSGFYDKRIRLKHAPKNKGKSEEKRQTSEDEVKDCIRERQGNKVAFSEDELRERACIRAEDIDPQAFDIVTNKLITRDGIKIILKHRRKVFYSIIYCDEEVLQAERFNYKRSGSWLSKLRKRIDLSTSVELFANYDDPKREYIF